jgi:hypothetical protein
VQESLGTKQISNTYYNLSMPTCLTLSSPIAITVCLPCFYLGFCLTNHLDHIDGVPQVLAVSTKPPRVWKRMTQEDVERNFNFAIKPLADGQVFNTVGATLRVLQTPGMFD